MSSKQTNNAHDERLALIEARLSRGTSPLREVSRNGSSTGPHDIYGGSRDRLLQSLKRLTRAGEIQKKTLTSLTVFHLVEMGLLARDERGHMQVTPLGTRTLQEYDGVSQKGARPGDTAASAPSLFSVR